MKVTSVTASGHQRHTHFGNLREVTSICIAIPGVPEITEQSIQSIFQEFALMK